MKITKQKTWMIIEITMAAFLIISSCEEPDHTDKDGHTLFHNRLQAYKPIESIALQTIPFFINIPINY